MRRLIVPLIVLLASLGAALAQQQGETLTLARAVQTALEHHPSLRAAEAAQRSADAGVTLARSAYFPSLSASATASRTGGWFVFNPSITPREQAYNNYSAGLTATQLMYDFGRTPGRVGANAALADASLQDVANTRAAVTANAILAYLAVAQAGRLVEVAASALQQSKDHLTQAKAFVSVGRRTQIDVTKAEVDLANANVNLIRARNAERLARSQLDYAMGAQSVSDYKVEDSFTKPEFALPLDSAHAIAIAMRPDLLAAKARLEAQRSTASATRAGHWPTLSANGAYTWNGFDFPLLSRWNAGVTLSVPLFQGFGINAQVEQATANADASQASLDLALRAALLDVDQNYLAFREAEERIAATATLVRQAEENRMLVEKQYAAGVSTPLEVTDAQQQLSNAKITAIQALFDCNAAVVRLRKAMGVEVTL